MASRIRIWLGTFLLYVTEKVTGAEIEIKVQEPGNVNLADVFEEPECQHSKSVKASVMGRPFNRVCLECKEEFDGGSRDGD